MAELGHFDATTVEPSKDFEPIPNGKYLAVITDSETKPTKAGTGDYLQLKFEIIEGDHKGRQLWARLNLWNPNATAVEIARRELSAICHAAGTMQVTDSAQLHNLPIVISVKCTKRKDSGDLTNEIAGYHSRAALNGATPAPGSLPPWKRAS